MTNPDTGTGAATQLLLAFTGGDRGALDRMLPLVYDELHRLAEHYLADRKPDFDTLRFDVVGILSGRDGLRIDHIEDAF